MNPIKTLVPAVLFVGISAFHELNSSSFDPVVLVPNSDPNNPWLTRFRQILFAPDKPLVVLYSINAQNVTHETEWQNRFFAVTLGLILPEMLQDRGGWTLLTLSAYEYLRRQLDVENTLIEFIVRAFAAFFGVGLIPNCGSPNGGCLSDLDLMFLAGVLFYKGMDYSAPPWDEQAFRESLIGIKKAIQSEQPTAAELLMSSSARIFFKFCPPYSCIPPFCESLQRRMQQPCEIPQLREDSLRRALTGASEFQALAELVIRAFALVSEEEGFSRSDIAITVALMAPSANVQFLLNGSLELAIFDRLGNTGQINDAIRWHLLGYPRDAAAIPLEPWNVDRLLRYWNDSAQDHVSEFVELFINQGRNLQNSGAVNLAASILHQYGCDSEAILLYMLSSFQGNVSSIREVFRLEARDLFESVIATLTQLNHNFSINEQALILCILFRMQRIGGLDFELNGASYKLFDLFVDFLLHTLSHAQQLEDLIIRVKPKARAEKIVKRLNTVGRRLGVELDDRLSSLVSESSNEAEPLSALCRLLCLENRTLECCRGQLGWLLTELILNKIDAMMMDPQAFVAKIQLHYARKEKESLPKLAEHPFYGTQNKSCEYISQKTLCALVPCKSSSFSGPVTWPPSLPRPTEGAMNFSSKDDIAIAPSSPE
ncbi:MAG: hypothetical protein LBF66_02675 [Holosporales bacterium]|jgi:hypothetical protein|nr:hypothetical protein [Holosporales bacterium]